MSLIVMALASLLQTQSGDVRFSGPGDWECAELLIERKSAGDIQASELASRIASICMPAYWPREIISAEDKAHESMERITHDFQRATFENEIAFRLRTSEPIYYCPHGCPADEPPVD